ncbi:MAG: hypothetical protein IPL32_05555 [Chloracidobacterium sp.]|nr:hypothetical protein [Chloracidobacterium sp.]
MNEPFDWRRSDRRIYAAAAILFPIAVLIGFGPTYYLKFAFDSPPIPSMLVHLHGLLMTMWIILFITQVYLISSKKIKLHQKLGIFGTALAPLLVITGAMTGIASAARGGGVPGIPPLSFLIVPLGDVIVFAILFAGAVYYRRTPANHKRLILLTVLNFLPPALGRFPFAFASTPPFFYGIPDLIAISLLIYDTWRNGKLNRAFLAGTILLIASHIIRLTMAGTDTWIRIATWLTSLV